jgi:tetratricopeptide (TPR) repeat protein
LDELNRTYLAGDRTPNLLVRRAELLLSSGDVEEARRTYQTLARIPEAELLAREAMSEAEANLGDLAAAAEQLEAAYGLDPTPERLDRLVRYHELSRRTDLELALLVGLEPEDLTDHAARRLLELLVARADMEAVEVLLRSRAELATPDRATMRGALADLLVGSDRAEEAAERAARWFGRDSDAGSLARTVERLIERGFIGHARALSDVATESGVPGAHTVIPAFAAAGHGLIARTLLHEWLTATAALDADDQMALLAYSKTMNDFGEARALLRTGDVDDFVPEFVVEVLKADYFRFGPTSLADFRRYLVPEILDKEPIFAADLMLGQRRSRDAVRYLALAASLDLQPWEREAWSEIVERITPFSLRRRLMAIRP